MATKKQKLEAIQTVLDSYGATKVTALEVYTDVFKLGDGVIEKEGENKREFKSNPIGFGYNFKKDENGKPILHKNKDGTVSGAYERGKGKHIVLYEDTFAKSLKELQRFDFAIINGLSYFGGRNYLRCANKMHALILDLDGISEKGMYNFLYGCKAGVYPLPNYLMLSGTNCHLYYVFEEPVPLYPDIKLALKEFKNSLVRWIWNKNISTEEVQVQGINQGFRVIGGKTKPRSALRRVTAYRLNDHPYDLQTLNDFVPENIRIDDSKLFRIGKIPWAKAEKLYPEWAERVRARAGKFPGRLWDLSKQKGHKGDELYNWWLKRLRRREAVFGSRYFAMMCLVIFAVKCDVDYERLVEDCYSLIETMTDINPAEPFTEDDVECALECYDEDYATFPRKDIEHISHMPIPTNKRNHLGQAEHLELARMTKAVKKRVGKMAKEGRPDKALEVKKYILAHPEKSVTEIAKELGCSRTTVYKYKEE